jgi:hypothetical protein
MQNWRGLLGIGRASMHRARTVGKLLAFAAFDSAKENYAVAVASLLAGDRRSAAGRGGVATVISGRQRWLGRLRWNYRFVALRRCHDLDLLAVEQPE